MTKEPRTSHDLAVPGDVLDRERILPSTSALRVFVVAAQRKSFSRAADDLGLTQGGVSRAIRSIEVLVGRDLFERSPRGVVLTQAGLEYFQHVEAVLADLVAAGRQLGDYETSSQSLHVATLPSLGSIWLAPRLYRFAARHPEISLSVTANIGIIDLARSDIDCVIHYGTEAWPAGARSELLMQESLLPVCSPELVPPDAGPDASLLLKLPLIQHTHRPTAWRDWCQQIGLQHPAPTAGCHFEQYQMGIPASVAGLGAALMPPVMVADELASGELVPLHTEPLPSRWQYHFVFPEAKRHNPSLQRFRSWIVAEARQSERQAAMR